jgi:hypothetical protein
MQCRIAHRRRRVVPDRLKQLLGCVHPAGYTTHPLLSGPLGVVISTWTNLSTATASLEARGEPAERSLSRDIDAGTKANASP